MKDPTKILLAGDWHGNARWSVHAIEHARDKGADTIVQVGDFGYWIPGMSTTLFLRDVQVALEQADIQLYWIRGNHEYHPGIDEWDEATGGQPWSDRRYPNITHLPNGFRWTWWSQTWLALGGAHSVDRLMRTEGKSWWEAEHITDEQAARAMDGGEVDVMVTHDCPAGVDIPGIPSDPSEDTRNYWPMSELIASRNHRAKLARVVDAVKPKRLVHGHYHLWHQAWRGDALVVGLDCDATTLERNTLLLHKPEA